MKKLLALVSLTAFPLSACGGDDSPTDTSAPSTAAPQIANPASQFCIDRGGVLDIVDEEDGQVGYCNLPDGTRVEEWEYYRANNG